MAATAKQALYTRINYDNNTEFHSGNSVLSSAAPISDPEVTSKNTTVLLTGLREGGKMGSVRFYYNRKTFASLIGAEPLEVVWGSEMRIHDLIPKLNEMLGINLVEGDLVDAGLPPRDELFTSFSVVATYDSYGWLGSFVLNLQVVPTDVGDEVENPELGELGQGEE